ncbi:hypothetical protein LBMAG42_05740 [Deltaproteobacteria bacterium]|nr:hypothetical protein LBMAG42_05740 [Deltaproteobacteria bacterium]
MTCKELTERVMAYRDRELPLHVRLSLQFHAAICSCCRNLLSTYDETVAIGADLANEEVPEEVAQLFDDMLARAMVDPEKPED